MLKVTFVVCCALQLAALSQVAKDVWRTMNPGYRPAPDAAYTSADYAMAVDAILKSPYKAVDEEDLTAVLGKQPLEAMVQANLLALRPYSFWAEDIDAAAFGVDLDATVVTAPTPLHLHLMQEERSIILAALDTQQVGGNDVAVDREDRIDARRPSKIRDQGVTRCSQATYVASNTQGWSQSGDCWVMCCLSKANPL